MPRSDRNERVERLRLARSARAAEALAASQRAITLLANRGDAITFQRVAREAGVSVSYLRKSAVLSDRIRGLSDQRRQMTPASRAPSDATVRGLRNKIDIMSERLRRLEDENSSLRAENAALRGEVADARRRARTRPSGASKS